MQPDWNKPENYKLAVAAQQPKARCKKNRNKTV